MARNLKTGWVVVATSGDTTDGRKIEKKWLEDMAANYSERLYSAKIWPNHERCYGSQGKVLALKLEPASDPQLKGEVHLMAIIAPSDNLVYANQQGRLVHTSIEVLKNFAGRGFFYLGGLAVTDNPASLGTSELQFSDNADKFHIQGDALDLSSAEEKSFFDFFRTKKPTDTEQETEMTKEQFDALLAAQKETATALAAIGEMFKTHKPEPAPAPAPITPPAPEPTAEFVSKKDYDALAAQLKAIDDKFTELQKTPAGVTKPAGDDASAENAVIC